MGIFMDGAEDLGRPVKARAAETREDDEDRVGTYLKVVRFPEPTNPDGFVVLYLRPAGSFLFLGYRRGFERSVVAGTWSTRDEVVSLAGGRRVSTDAPQNQAGRFRSFFRADLQDHTPVLVGVSEQAGWSLLGMPGPLAYVGRETIVDPDGEWLPRSLEAIDAWVERLMAV